MANLHPAPPFDELTYFPTERWIRGTLGERTVVDTRRALLVWEAGKMVPVYAFPREDVRTGANGAAAPEARAFGDPDLDGYLTLAWDALDHWYEEDEEVFVHPRDPFVRVEVLESSRHVRVERDGRVLADSHAPILIFETGLPTRYYLPPGDVDPSLLERSDSRTGCPYKGFASYRDVVIGDRRHPDLFWSYEQPLPEVAEVAGYLAPYNERVDLVVDGERRERPAGPLAAGRRASVPKS
jgi:uncharacterized protein (DUF427 family)